MSYLAKNYPLYEGVYGTEIPTEQYYVINFDTLPSKFLNNLFYDYSINEYLIDEGFKKECTVFVKNRRLESNEQSLYVHIDKKISIRTYRSNDVSKNNYIQIEILYDVKLGKIEEQLDFVELKKLERFRKKSNINLVKSDMGHLDIEQYDLPIPPINLELNYGEEFKKIHNAIVKKLNEENGKGIILLHGDPGTGKTSYIKYLTSLIKDKDILFIPPSMAEMLSEPTIIPFLMEHKNSILIIEDAERVIGDREGNGSPAGVSNILNLTDGILGDCLSIQIVATFNMRREKIDKALLRKGRLIVEHKFEKLTIEETNKLLKHLGKDDVSSEPMCLADIYNIDVELHKTSDKTSKIGF
jgi:energy-coupling factor transporter ATP-binding protein EcfA2